MILLYNVYLDDKIRIPGFFYRGNYGDFNNSVDVFKYALSSVANIYPWSKIIINVELNPTLHQKKEELNIYIKKLFENHNLILNNKRCERQSDWKKLYKELDNDLIYFCCNHDHIFIDKDPYKFTEDVNVFKSQFSETEASLFFSHWPEYLILDTNKKQLSIDNEYLDDSKYILHDNFLITLGNCVDSIQIITKKLYYTWWFTGDFNDKFLPRTDYANFNGCEFPNKPIKFQLNPYREYFRHFDGYSHIVNPPYKPLISSIIPPLYIPSGFFNNDIKLKIGYNNLKQDYININLSKENSTVIDSNGTDLKCFIDEIPYFWKDKISYIDSNPEYNESDYKSQRDLNIIDPILCGYFHGRIEDQSIINKIKQSYNIQI